jgi:hypothetical protein
MLPTNEKAEIGTKNWYFKGTQALIINEFVSNIYILSDDEIKVGDWNIDDTDAVRQSLVSDPHYWSQRKYYKKIIATTDKSLCDGKCAKNECVCVFPQPSEGFIDVYVDFYNRGKPITEVMVEYEKVFGVHTPDFSDELKVNPKDNTITIKKVKDSWSREEVEDLLRKMYYQATGKSTGHPDGFCSKWIEENL